MTHTARRFVLLAFVMATVLLADLRATDALRLPGPDYVDAVERWRAGKAADALAQLDRAVPPASSDVPIPALLLRAALLEDAGRLADAEPLWRTVMGREPALAEYAAGRIVANYSSRRMPALAAAEAARPPLADASGPPADLALAIGHAYRAAGDDAAAIGQYRSALSRRAVGTVADTARLSLASALAATGDVPGAIDVLRDAQRLFTDGRTYVRARAEAVHLLGAKGGAGLGWSGSDYAALTKKLRDGSRFAEAAALYEEWRALPGADQMAIDVDLVDTLYDLRANDDAMSRAAVFLETYPSSPSRPHIQLTQFRLDVREGRVDDAERRGMAFVDNTVAGASAAERRAAASLLASYLVAVGRVQKGLEAYRTLYALTPPSDDRSLVLWREGVAAVRAGDLVRAGDRLRRALAMRPRGETKPAAEYWLAAIAAQQGRMSEAAATWRQLAAAYPLNYYGTRSADRLAALGGKDAAESNGSATPPPPAPQAGAGRGRSSKTTPSKTARGRGTTKAQAQTPPSAPRSFVMPTLDVTTANADYQAASLLARAGLREPAADYARRVLAARRNSRGVALLAARAAEDAGQYQRALSLAVSHFGSDVSRPTPGAPADLAALAYPRAYWEDVRTAGEAHDVEPWLMLALARKESLFDTTARSAAGAIGMFQLMPATAGLVAADAGVESADEEALLQPSQAARLAGRLLRTLLDRYDGKLPAVIAAYNAGHERVDLWWKTGASVSEDLFIDTIPYSETRRYVREVLSNLRRYREIYGKAER